MTKFTATVQKLGRITIPHDLRRLRMVEEGDIVEVELVAVHKPDNVVVRKMKEGQT